MKQQEQDLKYMTMAIEIANEKMLAGEGGPFGAVIVKDGKIISKGWNKVTSTNDPTAHAEIVAIRKCCSSLQSFDLKGCILYSSCEPCPMCMGAVYWSGIKRVVYGANRHDAAAIGFRDNYIYEQLQVANEKKQVEMKQILRQESLLSLSAWDAFEDKIEY